MYVGINHFAVEQKLINIVDQLYFNKINLKIKKHSNRCSQLCSLRLLPLRPTSEALELYLCGFTSPRIVVLNSRSFGLLGHSAVFADIFGGHNLGWGCAMDIQ